MKKEELKIKTIKELADRLNEIMLEENVLGMEYNMIVRELQERLPNLKEDEDFQLKNNERQEVSIRRIKL